MLKWLTSICLCLAAGLSYAQQVDAGKAAELYKAGKMLDALPMYEELAREHPDEMLYQDHLAGCRTAEADRSDNPAERKRLALLAQEAAKRAVELGDTSYVIQMMAKRDLSAVAPASPMTPAQALLHEAEKFFSVGDFPLALAKYAQGS
jgi:hypothetical protein